MPDTVIPGIPATPGTPDTVIPGSPGTPGVSCPGPPVVMRNPKTQKYTESFQIDALVDVGGKHLPAGSYQVTWEGSGPSAQADILQGGNLIASSRARVVRLNRNSASDTLETRANSDGSLSLQSLRFAGQSFALYFDQGAARNDLQADEKEQGGAPQLVTTLQASSALKGKTILCESLLS